MDLVECAPSPVHETRGGEINSDALDPFDSDDESDGAPMSTPQQADNQMHISEVNDDDHEDIYGPFENNKSTENLIILKQDTQTGLPPPQTEEPSSDSNDADLMYRKENMTKNGIMQNIDKGTDDGEEMYGK